MAKWEQYSKKFCSRKCASNHPDAIKIAIENIKNVDTKGKNNPRYIDGRWIYRKAIFSIKENRCEVCRENKMKKLIAHHIDGNRGNNIENNLMIICYSCHSLVHKFALKTQKQQNQLIKYANQLI